MRKQQIPIRIPIIFNQGEHSPAQPQRKLIEPLISLTADFTDFVGAVREPPNKRNRNSQFRTRVAQRGIAATKTSLEHEYHESRKARDKLRKCRFLDVIPAKAEILGGHVILQPEVERLGISGQRSEITAIFA